MPFIKLYNKVVVFLTPLKILSLILLFIAVVNHIYNPFEHRNIGDTPPEVFARFVVLFCGMFGVLGNGKHIRIRTLMVGFPYLYISFLYIIRYIQTGVQTIVLPLTIILPIGLWIVFAGAEHEWRTRSICDRTNSSNSA